MREAPHRTRPFLSVFMQNRLIKAERFFFRNLFTYKDSVLE